MSILLTIILIALFVSAVLCGAPLFTIIGGATILLFHFIAHGSVSVIIVEMSRLADAPGFIAIPLFIFAGFVFAESNSTARLIRVSNALLGWLSGGLAVVTAIVCTIFTALTGGSGITIVACGGILLPALIKARYDADFSLGFVTSAASSGVLFIPSLPIIIYGLVSQTPIDHLFIASILPGLLIVTLLAGYAVFYGSRNRIETVPFSWNEVGASLWEIKWVAPLPFVVIGGIYTGLFTVGEAASAAAVYALISEGLLYREIGIRDLIKISVNSMMLVGAILIVLGTALGFTNFLVDQEIPQKLMEFILANISSKIVFILLLNGFLLIVGCLMDIYSATVVVVPLIAPVAIEFGIDPVHLGVMFLANLQIAYITPPVGMNLFIASLRFDASILRLFKVVMPALGLFLIAILIISFWPQFSLFLLELSGQQGQLLPILVD